MLFAEIVKRYIATFKLESGNSLQTELLRELRNETDCIAVVD
jgi:hypothetical protein